MQHLKFSPRHARQHLVLPALFTACAAIALTTGCRSYTPRAIDLAAHRDAFLAGTTMPEEARDDLAAAAGASLSPDAAEELALLLNPALRVARWRAGIAQATADNAGLWADPTLGFDLTRILEGPSKGWELIGSVGLTIPVSGRLGLEKRRAESMVDAERARLALLEWETRAAARGAYMNWCAAHAACAEERAFTERLAGILRLVDMLETRGELARAEARLFRIEAIEARAKLSALESELAIARGELLRTIGLAPTTDLAFDPGAIEAAVTVSDEAVREHPRLAVARAEYAIAERTLELEVRRQYPDLEIGPGYGEQDGDRQFVLGLGVALPILNANRQAILEAEAAREAARVAAEAEVESLVAEAVRARIALDAACVQHAAIDREILPLVEAQTDDVRRLAELGGEIDALILLDSLKRGRDARLARADAVRGMRLAEIELRTLRGPEVEPDIEPTDEPASEEENP